MSTKGEPLYHPVNGSVEETWEGFSWPAFFFGVIWLAVRSLWGHLVVNVILMVVTGGFAAPVIWIVYGFIGNGAHRSSLLKKGYLSQAQRETESERRAERAPLITSTSTVASPARSKIEQLQDLAALREKGFLTEEEFTQEKSKLLSAIL